MPALTNLVLNDGTANQTFLSIGKKGTVGAPFVFINSATGVRKTAIRVEVGYRNQSNGKYRLFLKLHQPIVRVINGVDTEVDSNVLSSDSILLSPLSTAAERVIASNLFKNLCGHAFVTAMISNMEGITG